MQFANSLMCVMVCRNKQSRSDLMVQFNLNYRVWEEYKKILGNRTWTNKASFPHSRSAPSVIQHNPQHIFKQGINFTVYGVNGRLPHNQAGYQFDQFMHQITV
jgi:hypothetical protein